MPLGVCGSLLLLLRGKEDNASTQRGTNEMPSGATGGLDLWHRIVRSGDVGKMRFIPSAPGNAVKEVLGYLSAEFCLGFLLQYLNTR